MCSGLLDVWNALGQLATNLVIALVPILPTCSCAEASGTVYTIENLHQTLTA